MMQNRIDVIMPVLNVPNIEIFLGNLQSIYREVPVNRLIIGDAGLSSVIRQVLQDCFLNVEILDHTKFHTLGYSLKKLIEAVETFRFAYFHADVSLPPGWFSAMESKEHVFDWFECYRKNITDGAITINHSQNNAKRPYSGSQLGITSLFTECIKKIEDDYIYRNEDFIFKWMIENEGGRYGRVAETFHYHQISKEKACWSEAWKVKTYTMQFKGLVKYTNPTDDVTLTACLSAYEQLRKRVCFDAKEIRDWVLQINPRWESIARLK